MGANKVTDEHQIKVWLACHPMDAHFISHISLDIEYIKPCKIYSSAMQWDTLADKEFALQQMQLIVVLVTKKLLTAPNEAMDLEFTLAKNAYIPVLPILLEGNLDQLYAKKFGKIQYLDRYVQDGTMIPYAVKLSNYLNNLFPMYKPLSQIKSAFVATIFLSYRKKNRALANQLMSIIHSDDALVDVSFFFDEFLEPGEDFSQMLQQQIVDCDLFLVLGTPQVLETGNYVLTDEYPFAKELGKPILAVEASPSDMSIFSNDQIWCIKMESTAELLSAIKSFLQIPEHIPPKSASHKFLIGLAYLYGIGVEIDRRRGIQLITHAAIAGSSDAYEFLSSLYHAESGLSKDYLDNNLKLEAELHNEKNGLKEFYRLSSLGDGYRCIGNSFENPLLCISYASDRAITFYHKALSVSRSLKIDKQGMQTLFDIHLGLSVLLATPEDRFREHQLSINIAEELVQEWHDPKGLELLAWALSVTPELEEPTGTFVDNLDAAIQERLKTNAFMLVDVLEKLYEANHSKQYVQQLFRALCKCVRICRAENREEQAVKYLERSLGLGNAANDCDIIRFSAAHLAEIYANKNDEDKSKLYCEILLSSMK